MGEHNLPKPERTPEQQAEDATVDRCKVMELIMRSDPEMVAILTITARSSQPQTIAQAVELLLGVAAVGAVWQQNREKKP